MAKPKQEERRRDTGKLVSAIEKLTDAVIDLHRRFDIAEVENRERQKKIDDLDAEVNGNGKPGLKADVQELKLKMDALPKPPPPPTPKNWFVTNVLPSLVSTGILGVIGFLLWIFWLHPLQ